MSGVEIKSLKVVAIDSANITGSYREQVSSHRSKEITSSIPISEIKGIQKLKNEKGHRQGLYIVKPGSDLKILLTNGKTIESLKVTSVDSTGITGMVNNSGVSEDGTPMLTKETATVNQSEIVNIQIRVQDQGKTDRTTGITAAVIILGVLLIGLSIFATAFN